MIASTHVGLASCQMLCRLQHNERLLEPPILPIPVAYLGLLLCTLTDEVEQGITLHYSPVWSREAKNCMETRTHARTRHRHGRRSMEYPLCRSVFGRMHRSTILFACKTSLRVSNRSAYKRPSSNFYSALCGVLINSYNTGMRRNRTCGYSNRLGPFELGLDAANRWESCNEIFVLQWIAFS